MIRYLKLTLVVSFCFVVASAFLWTKTEAQETPAEKVFKNIKALKGIPASQMTPIMEHFNKALGVQCTYCHEENALEKDTKPAHKKTVAEINMTRTIASQFKTSLDCMSCHQGKAKPPSSPMAALLGRGTVSGPIASNPNTGPGTTPGTTNNPGTTTPPKDTTPPASSGAGPADVVIPASFGRVPFPHGKHMEAFMDCTKCHHTGETNKCSTCHKKTPSAVTKVRGQDAAHSRTSERACAGCHLAMKVGPTTCAACHKK
jgi:hypothetical protein